MILLLFIVFWITISVQIILPLSNVLFSLEQPLADFLAYIGAHDLVVRLLTKVLTEHLLG